MEASATCISLEVTGRDGSKGLRLRGSLDPNEVAVIGETCNGSILGLDVEVESVKIGCQFVGGAKPESNVEWREDEAAGIVGGVVSQSENVQSSPSRESRPYKLVGVD